MKLSKISFTYNSDTFTQNITDLSGSNFIFVRRDAARRPFQHLFSSVLQKAEKDFEINKFNRKEIIFADRLKAAYIEQGLDKTSQIQTH